MSGRMNFKGLVVISVIVTVLHTHAAQATWENVIFHDDAVVASGEIYGSVTVHDSPPETTTIEFYAHGEYLTMYDSSTLNLHEGGTFESYNGDVSRLHDSSTLNVYEGAMIGAGSAASMNTGGSSMLNIYGGMVDLLFSARDCSTANLYDGSLGLLTGLGDNSVLNVYGGLVDIFIDNVEVSPTATVNIYGYDFEYNPEADWRYWEDPTDGWWVSKLTGYGFEGDPITFWGLPDPDTHDNINLIPEPTTVLLLGLGWVALLRIRRRDMNYSG